MNGMENHYFTNLRTILFAGLISGFADGIGGVLSHLLAGGGNPVIIFQYIASVIIGKASFEGGFVTAFMGLLIHFLIATIFSAVYFYIYPQWSRISDYKFINGVLYGVFVWMVMNLIVLPIVVPGFTLILSSSILGIFIHIVCVGLPISFIIGKRQRTVS